MSAHEEFPELTPEALAATMAGWAAAQIPTDYPAQTPANRRYVAAFLREALGQAGVSSAITFSDGSIIGKLFAIAANLHSPPPPPPTLAQARAADLDTPAGKAVVRGFLATLGEGVQP